MSFFKILKSTKPEQAMFCRPDGDPCSPETSACFPDYGYDCRPEGDGCNPSVFI